MSIHPFIGRKRELQLLQTLTQKRAASLVVIRGRRRIGKSRLAEEFARNMTHYAFTGLPPTEGTTPQGQREEFARQLQQQLGIPLPRADDWSDLFWLLAQHLKKRRIVLTLDEISWMGSKDPLFLGKLKNAWDMHWKSNPQLIVLLCGSVSTWIEKNILSSTGFFGRISLDIILEELLLSDCNAFWDSQGGRVAAYDKLKLLSVTGGVPRYLEEIVPAQSAEENISRLCFQREGLLFHEFERIFSDLFANRSEVYKAIVRRLADGPCELDAIYKALNVTKSGVVNGYVADLVTSGFVAQDNTWHLKTGKQSKLSRYRLKDNYVRFYLKYIEPHRQKIEHEGLKIPPQWHSIMGLQFENLVLNNRKSIRSLLGIDLMDIVYDNPYFQRPTKHQSGCQVDYMIQNRFGTCYLCEIKLCPQEVSSDVIDEVQQKIARLTIPKHISIRPVLIHVNGVSEEVLESGFFASCIDFQRLLEH